MSTAELKIKISESLDAMDTNELKQAWIVLKEINAQKNRASLVTNKKAVELQIANGIAQLDKGEGSDFKGFIDDMRSKYDH